MTHTESPTLEDLTATIHVLRVGGLQVTPAVVKQLDQVPFDQTEIFGRIHSKGEGLTFIGRHQHTGALVTSNVARHHFGAFEDYAAWRDSVGRAYPPIVLAKLY